MSDLTKLSAKLKGAEAKRIAQMQNMEVFREFVAKKFLEAGANQELVRTVILDVLQKISREIGARYVLWHVLFTKLEADNSGARTWLLEICPLPLKYCETGYAEERGEGGKPRHKFSDVASGLETVSYDLFEGWIGHAQMMEQHKRRKT